MAVTLVQKKAPIGPRKEKGIYRKGIFAGTPARCPTGHLAVKRGSKIFLGPKSAVKQRGQEKKGPPDIALKSFSQKGPKMVLCSFHRSHREICTPNQPVLGRNFWMISGGPFLSRPCVLLLAKVRLEFSRMFVPKFAPNFPPKVEDFLYFIS